MVDIDYFHFTLGKTCDLRHNNSLQLDANFAGTDYCRISCFNVTKLWDVLPDESVSCPSLQ